MQQQKETFKITEKDNVLKIEQIFPGAFKILGAGFLLANSTFLFIFWYMGMFDKNIEMLALGGFLLVGSPAILFLTAYFTTTIAKIDLAKQLIKFKMKSVEISNIETLRIVKGPEYLRNPGFTLHIVEQNGNDHPLHHNGTNELVELAAILKPYIKADLQE